MLAPFKALSLSPLFLLSFLGAEKGVCFDGFVCDSNPPSTSIVSFGSLSWFGYDDTVVCWNPDKNCADKPPVKKKKKNRLFANATFCSVQALSATSHICSYKLHPIKSRPFCWGVVRRTAKFVIGQLIRGYQDAILPKILVYFSIQIVPP